MKDHIICATYDQACKRETIKSRLFYYAIVLFDSNFFPFAYYPCAIEKSPVGVNWTRSSMYAQPDEQSHWQHRTPRKQNQAGEKSRDPDASWRTLTQSISGAVV